MAKDPAFLFYYQDFLVGTEFMTAEEVGCYIRILCHLADKGRLSLKHMQSICKGYAFTDDLKSKFLTDKDGLFYHGRLSFEVQKRKDYTQSRRDNAKAYAKHMEDENENVIEDIKQFPYLTDKKFLEWFVSYLDMRKKIRKPATDKAKEIVLKKLHSNSMPVAIKMIEQSIENSWQGIFPLKTEKGSSNRAKDEYKHFGEK